MLNIDIIFVGYNSAGWVKPCLDKLAGVTYPLEALHLGFNETQNDWAHSDILGAWSQLDTKPNEHETDVLISGFLVFRKWYPHNVTVVAGVSKSGLQNYRNIIYFAYLEHPYNGDYYK